jgi:hypothetical protein
MAIDRTPQPAEPIGWLCDAVTEQELALHFCELWWERAPNRARTPNPNSHATYGAI